MINCISFKTHFGWLHSQEINGEIQYIKFGKKKHVGNSKILKNLEKKIINFFMKRSTKIDISIKLKGSKLEKKIWKELMKIPYGEISTYGKIAKKLNTSPRYVGNVCGKNNFLLIVPCHRVIRSDGKLGGFSALGGINLKKRLLMLEKLNTMQTKK